MIAGAILVNDFSRFFSTFDIDLFTLQIRKCQQRLTNQSEKVFIFSFLVSLKKFE